MRVQLQAAPATLEPTHEPLGKLVFDRLIDLDERQRPRPALALTWEHDAGFRRWQFRLRPRVRFHDGSVLDAATAAAALGATAAGDQVIVQLEHSAPDLLLDLAGPAGAVFRRTADGALAGTGPFRVARWEPGRRATLQAHEDHWAGRPFLDAIEIELGRSLRDQSVDLELGKADLVEIAPADLRRVAQRGFRTETSTPATLLALLVTSGDRRLREALAAAVDRAAIHNVLLGRQGEPAGGLLPQWLSGWAFLFSTAPDLERARRLVAETGPAALTLSYDPADRAVAERIAVNAREAGLPLRAVAGAAPAEVRLVRRQIGSRRPAAALRELATAFGLPSPTGLPATEEETYAWERSLVEGYRLIPIVHLPELYAAARRVHFWNGRTWADVWLEGERP